MQTPFAILNPLLRLNAVFPDLDQELFNFALSHYSKRNFQRLKSKYGIIDDKPKIFEYLGDTVLQYITMNHLLTLYGLAITSRDYHLITGVFVSNRNLTTLSKKLGFCDIMYPNARLHNPETNDWHNPCSNAIEAILGVLYFQTRDINYISKWFFTLEGVNDSMQNTLDYISKKSKRVTPPPRTLSSDEESTNIRITPLSMEPITVPIAGEPEVEPQPELEPEVEPQLELEPEVEPQLEPEVEPQLEPEVEPQLEPEVEPQPEVEPEVEPQPEPESQPEVEGYQIIPKEVYAKQFGIYKQYIFPCLTYDSASGMVNLEDTYLPDDTTYKIEGNSPVDALDKVFEQIHVKKYGETLLSQKYYHIMKITGHYGKVPFLSKIYRNNWYGIYLKFYDKDYYVTSIVLLSDVTRDVDSFNVAKDTLAVQALDRLSYHYIGTYNVVNFVYKMAPRINTRVVRGLTNIIAFENEKTICVVRSRNNKHECNINEYQRVIKKIPSYTSMEELLSVSLPGLRVAYGRSPIIDYENPSFKQLVYFYVNNVDINGDIIVIILSCMLRLGEDSDYGLTADQLATVNKSRYKYYLFGSINKLDIFYYLH